MFEARRVSVLERVNKQGALFEPSSLFLMPTSLGLICWRWRRQVASANADKSRSSGRSVGRLMGGRFKRYQSIEDKRFDYLPTMDRLIDQLSSDSNLLLLLVIEQAPQQFHLIRHIRFARCHIPRWLAGRLARFQPLGVQLINQSQLISDRVLLEIELL